LKDKNIKRYIWTKEDLNIKKKDNNSLWNLIKKGKNGQKQKGVSSNAKEGDSSPDTSII
jgi:hypothetical protein